MADSIFDFDPVAANNTSYAGIPYGPNQLYHNQIDNLFRAYAGALGGFVDDLGAVATPTGSATAVAVTLSQGFTGYGTAAGEIRHGTLIALKMPWAATAAATLAINAIAGTKKIRRQGDAAIEANDWIANGIYFFRYDTAYDSANGAWVLMNPAFSATSVETTWQSTNTPINLSLAVSVGSSALTIAIKGHDGNDPSASNKVYVPFRNVTANSGDVDVLTLTAAASVVVSSGSTLGTANGVASTLAVVAFNDGGTFRLGVINPTSLPVRDGIASSTAEGGAGAADSAGTIYTGTAVTSKAMRVIGFITITEATAGTWASAPTTVQVGDGSDVALATGAISIGTPTASTSGTAIDYTSIPAGVKKVTIDFAGVSLNADTSFLIQFGTSGGLVTSGYVSASQVNSTTNVTSTAGFVSYADNATIYLAHFEFTLVNAATGLWSGGATYVSTIGTQSGQSDGYVTLSGVLSQLRIRSVNGTATFDAGTVNVSWE